MSECTFPTSFVDLSKRTSQICQLFKILSVLHTFLDLTALLVQVKSFVAWKPVTKETSFPLLRHGPVLNMQKLRLCPQRLQSVERVGL